jgi:hypothetical protein
MEVVYRHAFLALIAAPARSRARGPHGVGGSEGRRVITIVVII